MRGSGHFGLRVYGLGAVALGGVDLAFQKLAAPWQAVPGLDPGPAFVPILIGLALLLGGAGLQARRSAAASAWLLTAVYLLFAAGWLARVIALPAILGTWLGICEQLALAIGGVACWLAIAADAGRARSIAHACRIGFGLCCLVFGAAHFVYAKETGAMVPTWLPGGGLFWAHATGIAHALAGLALVSGIRALIAARLLTAMFVGFGLLVWLPMLVKSPELSNWGGNAVNLALVGAAWAVADMIARFGSADASRTLLARLGGAAG
jgi:hypothetical protein